MKETFDHKAENWTVLQLAAKNTNEKIITAILEAFPKEYEDRFIDFYMKGKRHGHDALYEALRMNLTLNVKILVNKFPHNRPEKFLDLLMDYIHSNREIKSIILKSVQMNNINMMKVIFEAFGKHDRRKLIELLTGEYGDDNTILHLAAKEGTEETVRTIIEAFPIDDADEFDEFIMKENSHGKSAIILASENENQNENQKIRNTIFESISNFKCLK